MGAVREAGVDMAPIKAQPLSGPKPPRIGRSGDPVRLSPVYRGFAFAQ